MTELGINNIKNKIILRRYEMKLICLTAYSCAKRKKMHLLNRMVICTLTLFSFACANIPKSRTEEEKRIILPEGETSANCITEEELESFSFNTLECVQALLTGDWFTRFEKSGRPLIFLFPPETEPAFYEQGKNFIGLFCADLLQTQAVNLVVCDSVFTLPENREKILQLVKKSGADFFLQSIIAIEEGIPLLKLNLYNVQNLAIVYSDTRSLLLIKI